MTTTTKIAALIRAEFDVTAVTLSDIQAMLADASDKIVDANAAIQEASYAALYCALHSFNKTPLSVLFNSLSNAGGMFDESRFKNLKLWVNRFFAQAAEKKLITGKDVYKFNVKQGDFSFTADVTLTDVMVADGAGGAETRKVTLPKNNTPEFAALALFLSEYANTQSVANASNDARKELNEKAKAEGKSTMSEKAEKAAEAKRLMSAHDNALSAEDLVKKAEVQKEAVAKSIKAAEKGLDNLSKEMDLMTSAQLMAMMAKMTELTNAMKAKNDALTAQATAAAPVV